MKRFFIFLTAAFIILSVFACKEDGGDGGSKAAALLTFKVGDLEIPAIPTAITEADWKDEEMNHVTDTAKTAIVLFNSSADVTNVAVSWTVSPGARAQYGVVTSMLSKPDGFNTDATATFASGNFVVVKVTAEDKKTVNYYRFSLTLRSSAVHISGLSIFSTNASSGASASSLGTPAASQGAAAQGRINLTAAQCLNAEVTVTKGYADQTLRYAVIGTPAGNTPQYSENNTFERLYDGQRLIIEVTAANGIDKQFYRILIEMGRIASITSLTVGDTSETWFLGIPNAAWNQVLPPRTEPYNATDALTSRRIMPLYLTYQATDSFEIAFTTESYSAAQYALVDDLESEMPGEFLDSPVVLQDGKVLAVKVTSENENVFAYYKIPLRIPGVKITGQPAAGPFIYNVGDTPTALSITVEGSYDSIDWVYFHSRRANFNPVVQTANPPDSPVAEGTYDNQGFAIQGASSLSYTPDTSAPFIHTFFSNFGNSANPDWRTHDENFARYVCARIKRAGYSDTFSDRVVVNVIPAGQIKDFTVDLSKMESTRLGPFTSSYQNLTASFPADMFPSDFDITKYSRFTAAAIMYSGNGEIIRQDNDKMNFAVIGSGSTKACYNLGEGENGRGNNTTNNTLLQTNEDNNNNTPFTSTPTGFRLGTAGISSAHAYFPHYIELIELRFSGPGRE